MTVSQQIDLINENNYDNVITVTDVPNKHYIAVTDNQIPSGSSTREITIDILHGGEWASGGTLTQSSGMFVRTSNETSIKVTVKKDGNVLAENTTSY